ncbi:MAG TPA: DUF438 domain-containing protein [Desulfobacteria bacterium]|nr:DUF438 domain-containing protein [Desulfobacteria bacterium]
MTDNTTRQRQRLETLKQIIRDVHNNHDPQELKERFKKLIKDTGATDIAQMEQELIAEGMPESEIKRLCDVHALVFREKLPEQQRPEETSGHPVHTSKLENRAIEQVIGQIHSLIDSLQQQGLQEQLLTTWRETQQKLLQLDRHYSRKENILFPYLEKHGISGPPSVMWGVDDDIRKELKEISKFLAEPIQSKGKLEQFITETVLPCLNAIKEMIFKEENILFPMSLDTLNAEEWAAIAGQSDDIGYCLVEPERNWRPKPGTAASATVPRTETARGTVRFKTGTLSPQELELLLNHLPLDITFVDKDNKVKYFSAGKERIFPRTPAIIGREVQNCHPPDSVHVVNKIVEEFRSGTRDSADFWLKMNGMFVYIQYFAVRDEAHNYLGTLEVTQNVAPLQSLKGEKTAVGLVDCFRPGENDWKI